MSEIEVVLVDQQDGELGTMEKLEAHRQGLLHRAVTVYVFNQQGQVLLQRRAQHKYHCGGLWSNTCCSHPFPGESVQAAAERRLNEEMGMTLALDPVFETQYNLAVDNGLIEHEYGHVFFAISDQTPVLNPQEADDWRYQSFADISAEIAQHPEHFTPWFRHTFPHIASHYQRYQAQGINNP